MTYEVTQRWLKTHRLSSLKAMLKNKKLTSGKNLTKKELYNLKKVIAAKK